MLFWCENELFCIFAAYLQPGMQTNEGAKSGCLFVSIEHFAFQSLYSYTALPYLVRKTLDPYLHRCLGPRCVSVIRSRPQLSSANPPLFIWPAAQCRRWTC